MEIQNNICHESATLREAMERLNYGVYGIIVLVDDKKIVKGILTDGDIRRALLKGYTLNSSVSKFMNRNFVYVLLGNSQKEYIRHLTKKIQHVLVLDKKGHLSDIIAFKNTAILPISAPSLDGNELKYITQCITTNWISSQGNFVKEFEDSFASFHGTNYQALTTSNGTAALHLALLGCGIQAGDEVLVPVSTFAATANSVIHAGAKPIFVDIDPQTWCIDPMQIERHITPQTKALIIVHLYGHPAEMDTLLTLAKKHNLKVIEDCAESLGARYKDKLTGTFGDVGCYSFFSNKVITTGEGGMVISHDKNIICRIQQLRDHGTSSTRRYWHEVVGYNYRLTNLQAAIGLAQLERIKLFLKRRNSIAKCYRKNLEDIPGISLPHYDKKCWNIFWLYTIIVNCDKFGLSRDQLIEHLHKYNIDSRPFFPALYHQPAFQKFICKEEKFPVALHLEKCGISLPTGNTVTKEEVEQVCSTIRSIYYNKE